MWILGVLADVLRNYVMSSTSAVFQKSKQAEHIRVNFLRIRLEGLYPGEGLWDDGLERAMRTMSLKIDPDAPVGSSLEIYRILSYARMYPTCASASWRGKRQTEIVGRRIRSL